MFNFIAYKLLILIIIATCCCFQHSIQATEDNESQTDGLNWHTAQYKLIDGPPLEPLETFEVLKLLSGIHAKRVAQLDNSGLAYANLVADQVEFGNISKAKCMIEKNESYNYFLRLESQIEASLLSSNIWKYLTYCRKKQIQLCKQTFIDRLKKSIGRLSEQEKVKMTKLSNNVNKAKESLKHHRAFGPTEWFAEGIATFMTQEGVQFDTKTMFDFGNGLEKYNDEFEGNVELLCDRVKRELGSSLIYFDPNIITDLDEDTRKWIDNIRNCATILKGKHNILLKGYKASLKHHCEKSEMSSDCKQSFVENLNKAILESISEQDRLRVSWLSCAVTRRGENVNESSTSYSKRLLEVMEYEGAPLKSFLDLDEGKINLRFWLKDKVVQFVHRVDGELRWLLEMYELLYGGDKRMRKEKFVFKWMTIAKFCKNMQKWHPNLIQQIHSLLYQVGSSRSVFRFMFKRKVDKDHLKSCNNW